MARDQGHSARRQVAKASGRTVELAVQRALAELDFAPGELTEDQYEVTILIPPEEGFMGVGAVDAIVEVALIDELFDFYGPEGDSQPPELLVTERENEHDESGGEEESYEEFADRVEIDEEPTDSAEAARLRAFLGRVLAELGLAAKVRISESPDELRAEVSGEDLGILIGRRGQTIDAVEYLASIAVFQGGHAGRKHVELDAEGYKERRRRQIERMAVRKAQEATKRGRPVELAPMSPAERKIVHLSLKGRGDVVTESQGREPNRSVVISPVR